MLLTKNWFHSVGGKMMVIGFRACGRNVAGNQKIITVMDNYMYVAIELQGSFLKRFFSHSKKF